MSGIFAAAGQIQQKTTRIYKLYDFTVGANSCFLIFKVPLDRKQTA
jgi:hypothetical protein